MSRKLPILALGAAIGGLVLSGCKVSQQTGKSDDKAVLRFWAMPNTTRPKEDLDTIIERFRQQNPDVGVEVEIIDWPVAWTKITNAVNSGAGADVFQLGTTWTSSITAMGGLLSLDSLVKQVGSDTVFVPAARAYMKPIYADSVTSFPWFVDVRPIFYRKDVLAKAGIKPDAMFATWDNYFAGLHQIKSAKVTIDGQRIEPLGLAGKDGNVFHTFYPWIIGSGGDVVNDLGDTVLLDDERTIKGVLTFLRLIREGLSPKAYLEKGIAQVSAEFDQGRIAIWQETSSKLVYLERPAELGGSSNLPGARNFATSLPPAGPNGRKLFIGGSNLAILKSTKNPEAAKRLLAFLTTDPQAVEEFCRLSGMAPALTSVFDHPYYQGNANRALFKDLVLAGKPYPAVPYWGELETNILNKHFGAIVELAAETNGPYSEEAVRKELVEAAAAARDLINKQITQKPGNAERLARLRAGGRR